MLFGRPAEQLDELNALRAELSPAWRDAAAGPVALAARNWEDEYHRVLGPAGIPAAESAYDDNALAGRGPVLADVAGFYRAFAYSPAVERCLEVADHVSIELDFLAFLAMKTAFAYWSGEEEAARVTEAAYREFLRYHVLFWMPKFVDRLRATDSEFYAAAADWLDSILTRAAAEEAAGTILESAQDTEQGKSAARPAVGT
jgi:TorA maturation chaperone TorD